jgi:transposase
MARKVRDADTRTRIQIVIHYARGLGCNQIAEALRIAPATAVRVANRFLEDGEGAFVDGRKENGTPKVDEDLLQALSEMMAGCPQDYGWARPTWTRELLAKTLKKETGVAVSVSTLARMLASLGARWGMARPIVQCPWSRRRKNRKIKQILQTVRNLPPREVAYYEDEVDIHLNPRIGRDWMMQGQQKAVLTPGRNKKRYMAGAVGVDGTGLVFVTGKRKNTNLFIELLKKLREEHPEARRIHLVLDNYVIHASKKLMRFLNSQDGVFVLHFLPPYCPNHNKIERLWRELHAHVTRNHRCSSLRELMARVRAFMNKEKRRRRPAKVSVRKPARAA